MDDQQKQADRKFDKWLSHQRKLTWLFITLEGAAIVAIATVVVMFYLATRGTCGFYHDIATAPINAKSSQLGVQIVVDSRNSFSTLHCSGALPPPRETLVELAHRYGISIPH